MKIMGLFGDRDYKPPQSGPFGWYANSYLPVGEGIAATIAQSVNEAIRHCRIGNVTLKVVSEH